MVVLTFNNSCKTTMTEIEKEAQETRAKIEIHDNFVKEKYNLLVASYPQNSVVELKDDNRVTSDFYNLFAIHYDTLENPNITNSSKFDHSEFEFNDKREFRNNLKKNIKYLIYSDVVNLENFKEYEFKSNVYNYALNVYKIYIGYDGDNRHFSNFLYDFNNIIPIAIQPEKARGINSIIQNYQRSEYLVPKNRLLGSIIVLYELDFKTKETIEDGCTRYVGDICVKFGKVKMKNKLMVLKNPKYNYILNNEEFKNY